MDANEFPFKQECYSIFGACMEVSNGLGCGFLEAVYQKALSIEFTNQAIPFLKEPILDIYYKEKLLTKKYIADFISNWNNKMSYYKFTKACYPTLSFGQVY